MRACRRSARRSTARGLDVEDRSGSGAIGTAHRRTHLIRGDADGPRGAQFDDRGANPSLIRLDRAERFQSQALPVRCPVGARRGLAEQAGIPSLKMGTGCSTAAAHAITMIRARPWMAWSRATISKRGLRTNGHASPILSGLLHGERAHRDGEHRRYLPEPLSGRHGMARGTVATEWIRCARAASRGESRTDLCRNANGMFIASRTASHHPVDRCCR